MKRQFITLLCAVCAFAASAQTRYLRINQLDGTVTEFAVESIDSIDFVTKNTEPTTPIYTVTLSVNNETMGTVTGAGTYEEGDTAILTATANEGYKFVKWSDEETENLRTITVVSDVTLIANFRAIDFNGHEYVDLGLPSGTLWATCNVGAENPEEYGDYFAWGETTPKKDDEGNYLSYDWSTYKYGTSSSNLTKYNTAEIRGTVDNKAVLDIEDDAAAVNWGGDWRMPILDEQKELLNNCTWTWTTDYNGTGINGYIVTSNAEGNTNSIFLPTTGDRYDSTLSRAGSYGYFWSSSLSTSYPYRAYSLSFNSGYYDWKYYDRFGGRCVRAVCSPK